MRTTIVIIITALAFGTLLGGLYAMQRNQGRTTQTEKSQTFADVRTQVEQGAKLYDVRTAEEYAEGHFAPAENLPLQDIEQGKLPAVDKSTMLYVYCRTGSRSAQAAAKLRDAGFTQITDLGGLTDVQSIGGTLTK